MKIKITVIIPVYNTEKFLKRCIESIIGQSLKEIEIIIINDNSTDNSKKILDEYSKKDERIIIINKKKNKGLSSARKSGLKKARGEYILNIDSDDWIEQNYFFNMYYTAQKYNADIVISDFYIDYDNGSIYYRKDQESDTLLAKEKVIDNIFNGNSAPAVWNKLIKRELYINNKIFPIEGISIGEDLVVIPRLINSSKKIVKLNEGYVHYIQHANSMTKQKSINNIFSVYSSIKILEKIFSEKETNNLKFFYLGTNLMLEDYDFKNSKYTYIVKDFFNAVNNYKSIPRKKNLPKLIFFVFKIKIFRNKHCFMLVRQLYNCLWQLYNYYRKYNLKKISKKL